MAARIAIEGWDRPKAKTIRENFAIPDPLLGPEKPRKVWRELVPIRIKQARMLGVKLDSGRSRPLRRSIRRSRNGLTTVLT